jgi:hypothetical protein
MVDAAIELADHIDPKAEQVAALTATLTITRPQMTSAETRTFLVAALVHGDVGHLHDVFYIRAWSNCGNLSSSVI